MFRNLLDRGKMKPVGRSYKVIVKCLRPRRILFHYVIADTKDQAKLKTMTHFCYLFERGIAKITDCKLWEFFS